MKKMHQERKAQVKRLRKVEGNLLVNLNLRNRTVRSICQMIQTNSNRQKAGQLKNQLKAKLKIQLKTKLKSKLKAKQRSQLKIKLRNNNNLKLPQAVSLSFRFSKQIWSETLTPLAIKIHL